jgi:hypothetical protein
VEEVLVVESEARVDIKRANTRLERTTERRGCSAADVRLLRLERSLMPIKVEGLAPLIQVFDMPTSVAFYREILGFAVVNQSEKRMALAR